MLAITPFNPTSTTDMSMLAKLKQGAQKAGIQATAFAQSSGNKLASGSRDFVQGFSLPGEADKAAKILDSFLGTSTIGPSTLERFTYFDFLSADPERPESALNAIPKAVLQSARGL